MAHLRGRPHLPGLSTSKHPVGLQLSLLPLLLEKRPFLGQTRLLSEGRVFKHQESSVSVVCIEQASNLENMPQLRVLDRSWVMCCSFSDRKQIQQQL